MKDILHKTPLMSLNRDKSFHQTTLFFCMISVFIWGMLAHAYGFLQDSFSHDVLNALYADSIENIWKVQIGRFLVPIYRLFTRGSFALPWLLGLISLLAIGLSVYLIVRMFSVQSKGFIFLISGLFTANICVSCLTASYIYELDVDMFALLAATGAAYLWHRQSIGHLFLGAVLAAVSLSLYQSYIGVTIALIFAACILSLLKGSPFKAVFSAGMKAIVMLCASALLYIFALCAVKLFVQAPVQANANHSFFILTEFSASSLITSIIDTYFTYAKALIVPPMNQPLALRVILGALLLIPAFLIIVSSLFSRRYGFKETLLLICLGGLLPFGSNISCFLSQGEFHDLMSFPLLLTYLLALLIIYWYCEQEYRFSSLSLNCKRFSIIALCLMLWSNVQTSNTLYLKKDLEQEATLSLMTRVLYRMEDNEEYITGESPIAFVGLSNLLQNMPGFEEISYYTGAWNPSAISDSSSHWYFNTYQSYFEYKLGNPAKICDSETWTALQTHPQVKEMPSYPADECMKMIDGVFVIKMGDPID